MSGIFVFVRLTFRRPFLVHLAGFALILGMGLAASEGLAVTRSAPNSEDERIDAVTTGAVNRARADVQIRRLKSLLASHQTEDEEAAFEELDRLQKNLHGEN